MKVLEAAGRLDAAAAKMGRWLGAKENVLLDVPHQPFH
jgi:hypothetical protein